jgi:hypothetical protein
MKPCLIFILSLLAVAARAERNPRSVAELTKTSILIVAGTVTNVQKIVTNGNTWITGRILVHEVLKGPKTNNVPVCWPRDPGMAGTADFTPRVVGRPLVWFLWRETDHGFELTFSEEVQSVASLAATRQAILLAAADQSIAQFLKIDALSEVRVTLAPKGDFTAADCKFWIASRPEFLEKTMLLLKALPSVGSVSKRFPADIATWRVGLISAKKPIAILTIYGTRLQAPRKGGFYEDTGGKEEEFVTLIQSVTSGKLID